MNKKLKFILNKMIINNTQLIRGYSSSSKDFQDKLRNLGILLPEKLYILYKFPNKMNAQQYEKIANTFEFYDLFPNCLTLPENLSDSERKELTDYIKEQKQIHYEQQKISLQELIKINPDLSKINIPTNKITDFLKGASYGFAPSEIDYFINEYHGPTDELEQFNQNMNEIFGFSPGYILSPKHQKMVLNSVINKTKLDNVLKKSI